MARIHTAFAVVLYGIQIVASMLSHKPFSAKPTSVVLQAAGLPPEEELPASTEDRRSDEYRT